MLFDFLHWSAIYLATGSFLNLVVSNSYKKELIAFVLFHTFKDVYSGKISKEKAESNIESIKNNFFLFSFWFSIIVSFAFPFILIPALFGKNPFSTENS